MAFKALVTPVTSSALSLQPHNYLTISSSKLDTCCLRVFALAVAHAWNSSQLTTITPFQPLFKGHLFKEVSLYYFSSCPALLIPLSCSIFSHALGTF